MCDALAVALVVSTVQGLYSAGSGSPSEDWEEFAIPLQKQKIFVFLCCSCEFPSTHP